MEKLQTEDEEIIKIVGEKANDSVSTVEKTQRHIVNIIISD